MKEKTMNTNSVKIRRKFDETFNRTLRGGYGYFQHSKANVFPSVDGSVRRRLRSLLEKRRGYTRQGLGQAHHRWLNEWFAQNGLLSLAVEHEWTRTIGFFGNHNG
jgi:RNA-directed DNA polymerase